MKKKVYSVDLNEDDIVVILELINRLGIKAPKSQTLVILEKKLYKAIGV